MGVNRYFGSNPKAFRLTGLFDQPEKLLYIPVFGFSFFEFFS
jgi:hypothetical protein